MRLDLKSVLDKALSPGEKVGQVSLSAYLSVCLCSGRRGTEGHVQ